jgi:hypothetical protein
MLFQEDHHGSLSLFLNASLFERALIVSIRVLWRRALLRIRRTWSALREATPGAIFVGGLAIAAVLGWAAGPDVADAIRYGGAALQLFGLLLVAHGLERTRAMFGRPTMLARVRDWIGRVLTSGRPQNVVLTAATGVLTVSGGSLTVAQPRRR